MQPAKISRTVPAWLVVMWMRFDPRIRWFDILVRMMRGQRPKANTLQMRCARWRYDMCLTAWSDSKGGSFHESKEAEDVELLLTPAQRQANTTRGLTPGPSHGFSNIAVVPKVSRKARAAQIEAARWAACLDINNLSDLSTSESDNGDDPNKRSRKSRSQHLKRRRHALKKQKAVGQALQSGEGGEAVVLPGRTPQVFLGTGLGLVFKNVIVIPDEIYEDDKTIEDDGVAVEDETFEEGAILEHGATTWGDDDGYEMSEESGDEGGEDQTDAQDEDVDDNDILHYEDNMGSSDEGDTKSAGLDKENIGSNTLAEDPQYIQVEGHPLAENSIIINEMGSGYPSFSPLPSPDEEVSRTRKRSRMDDNNDELYLTKRCRETIQEQNNLSISTGLSLADTQEHPVHLTPMSDLDYFDDLRGGSLFGNQATNETAAGNEQDDRTLQGDDLDHSGTHDANIAPPHSTLDNLADEDAQKLFPNYPGHEPDGF